MAATPKYAAKSTLRSLKNFSKGYTDMQAKVREATSNDPWGPSGTQMNELAMATQNPQAFIEIMEILDKRMNDKGKNWRHVFKALTVLDYLLHVGSEDVVRYARENLYIVKTLKEFQYIDEEGKDQGANVRQKAKDITALLSDEARLKEERRSRNAMRDRMSGRAPGDYDAQPAVYDRPGYGDDDRDLQRALEESRRMAQSESKTRRSEDDDLQKALELSKKEEQDRLDNVKKYNELSLTEDWETENKPTNLYEQQQNNNNSNNFDFFANDFGQTNNNNNNFDAFSTGNGFQSDNNAFLQQQPTGFNNPYLQLQQQQLQQQQMQQQQIMQQQLMQQQLQQQQQMAFMNTMNNPYQQQLMPQMTGAPAIGSNNPFSAFAQKPAMTGQPFGGNNNGFDSGFNSGLNNGLNSGLNSGLNTGFSSGFGNNNNNNTNTNTNKSSALSELSFLQDSMTTGTSSSSSQPATTKPVRPNDEKFAHLAMALQNRDDGMDTFGNTGSVRFPAHHGGAANLISTQRTGVNPFQGANANNSNSLIDVGDSGSTLLRSNTNNPFQSTTSGFLSSQATGFGSTNGNMFNQQSSGAYSSNTLF
ncbi:hypothetical protein B0O80DRAFT_490587 [Mortierella sp. GBAus27b]|nr:hypothetical protein BGX31_006023 [Mortierella sp. GBA43]KAI8347436.1 hypothetical protein B0O80DRAFT_490587 [Mortierella sp. GBAus27b]